MRCELVEGGFGVDARWNWSGSLSGSGSGSFVILRKTESFGVDLEMGFCFTDLQVFLTSKSGKTALQFALLKERKISLSQTEQYQLNDLPEFPFIDEKSSSAKASFIKVLAKNVAPVPQIIKHVWTCVKNMPTHSVQSHTLSFGHVSFNIPRVNPLLVCQESPPLRLGSPLIVCSRSSSWTQISPRLLGPYSKPNVDPRSTLSCQTILHTLLMLLLFVAIY
ncbi:hypothetical protein E2542_SST15311 [Spatholobus suberectus]|nr:hypothetical protein E2542_SST15311 [Spatholobus suberectus]